MNRFAFMVHPIDLSDVYRKFPWAAKLPEPWVEKGLAWLPPLPISEIEGISTEYGQASGCLVACPLTSRQIINLPEAYVIKKIIQTGRYAADRGAKIIGLGAMTSVVGDAGITVAKNLPIPVTTGNSYTVFTALAGMKKAAVMLGIDWAKARILVLGATGAIGSVCSRILARDCHNLTLAARDEAKLTQLAERIFRETGRSVEVTNQLKGALKQAELILAVSSAVDALITPEDLKVGAIVCDVSRPRSISRQVAESRSDVLVIEGGLIEIPGQINFNFNFGYPPGLALACMAETILLALEQRWENYTIGRDLTIEQVEEIGRIAAKHGFKIAGFRSFEKPVTDSAINRVKSALGIARQSALAES